MYVQDIYLARAGPGPRPAQAVAAKRGVMGRGGDSTSFCTLPILRYCLYVYPRAIRVAEPATMFSCKLPVEFLLTCRFVRLYIRLSRTHFRWR